MDKSRLSFSPIFNQTADARTWAFFADIEMKCDSVKYNYHVDDTDRARILQSHIQDWKKYKYNFAFAAYYDEQMVGFASGYLEDKTHMYLHNLYVYPEYNGFGIGKILLHRSERAAQLIVNNMSVVSLNGATGFYESRGYTGSNQRSYEKKLTGGLIGTVPVFNWRKFNKLETAVDIDKSLFVKNPYSPKFVYVAPGGKIVGAAIKTPDGENHIFVTQSNSSQMAEFYRNDLLRALSRAR